MAPGTEQDNRPAGEADGPAESEAALEDTARADRERRQTLAAWGAVAGVALLVVVLGVVIRARVSRPREEVVIEKPPTDVAVLGIEPREVVDRIRLPGTVSAWEAVTVSAEVPGVAVSVDVDEGDEVSKGDVLCRLEDGDYRAALERANAVVAQATAGIETAKAGLDLADLQLRRMKQLMVSKTVGQAEYDSAEAAARRARGALAQAVAGLDVAKAGVAQAGIALGRTVVRAPLAGVISRVDCSVGKLLSSGKPVAKVVDVSRVRVSVGIPERDVLAVRRREEFKLAFGSVPGREFTGRRTYLGIEPMEHARTYGLELAVANPERLLRPGMFATVDIIKDVRQDRVVIPLFSVISNGKDRIVFVVEDVEGVEGVEGVKDEGKARKRVVEIGLLMGGSLEEAEVEITRGLEAGERLIVIGQRQVEDGDKVKVGQVPEGLEEMLKAFSR